MSTEVINKTDMKWYVVRTQGNREKSVAEKIKKEGETGDLVGKIGQVLVPLEKSVFLKNKKVEKETIMFPGYIFMETNSLGELKYFLKGVKGATGFLAERNGDIQSLTEAEVNKMIGKQTESMNKKIDNIFTKGEEVKINEGAFASFTGTIEKIEDQKVTLAVSIFGRKTPVTLEMHQIDKKHS